MPGSLFIVATPIGNLKDITFRAVETLKMVDIIACEDTRRTKILTSHYSINKPMVSFYSYNQVRKVDYLIGQLKNGKNVALVSDAGTPGISDPGYTMIKAAVQNDLRVEAIPGPTALITALVLSGKPTNKFVFEGFLSNKSSQRRKRLSELKEEKRTIIIYESPHRIAKLLNDILDVMGDIDIVCAREITKKFEEIRREKAGILARYYGETRAKGEFIVII